MQGLRKLHEFSNLASMSLFVTVECQGNELL